MRHKEDKILLNDLKSNHKGSIDLLYLFYFPVIKNYIIKNQGNSEDAKDIFQESILILLAKVNEPDFELTASLKTYLFAISRNLWLKRLRDCRIIDKRISDLDIYNIKETEINYSDSEENSTINRLSTWLQRITDHCQQILNSIFYLQEPMDQLMVKMGWKNKHTADNQKYKCLQQIRKEKDKDLDLESE